MMTAALLTARDVGGLKAVGNLILPLAHTTAACSRLAQPYVSGISDQHGGNATARPAWRFGLVLAAGALAYSFVVTLFSDSIFRLLYQGKFVEYGRLFPWLGINFAFSVLSQNGLGLGLRALQSPSSVFTAIGAGAVVAIALGIPAGRKFGLEGMIGVSILASALTLALSAKLFRTKLQQSKPSVAFMED
jgi:O-antigen/teichoic acid export membrane protein